MVFLIKASISSFLWTVALTLLMTYIVAVYFTEMVTNLWVSSGIFDPNLENIFGDLPTSIMSLYYGVSNGSNWSSFTAAYWSYVSPEMYVANTGLLGLYVAFTLFVMVNLVTGVFVEGMHNLLQDVGWLLVEL